MLHTLWLKVWLVYAGTNYNTLKRITIHGSVLQVTCSYIGMHKKASTHQGRKMLF